MRMQQARNADHYARKLLEALYYYAKFLGVINCRLDKDQLKVHRVQRHGKCVARTVRLVLILTYIGALDNLFQQFNVEKLAAGGSYIGIFVILQTISVMVFAVFVFIVQTRCEAQLIQMLNDYMRLYQRIMERCKRTFAGHGMLNRKFLAILVLKLATTLIGYSNELPALLRVDDLLRHGPIHLISSFVGVYLWMGSMFVLDLCVLGLLVIALMYEEMGNFLRRMLLRMGTLEEADVVEHSKSIRNGTKQRLSNHKRMKLLCDCADVIADCDVIYANLYKLTKEFQHLFQWQIFYYIYYNFMVILLLFHNCIWIYLHADIVDTLGLLMVAIKIVNLAVLIMCADFAVQRFQMPQLLCLDVTCSDIDERWCMSVEAFLSRRQTERLEIRVIGFFQLNNEFILLILSAIVSYLFIIIQFGLTDME